mmetsp:Transcript_27115/g.49244  ORF Transcript_27115/g.49244 Transcript_27115/m.49244 type:complete len:92 (-) Transcript_27115:355-630(-)
MVRTTVSVVTVAAMSTAAVATSSAASVAAWAEWTMTSEAVSARMLAVRSGVKSQAEAAAGRDVVVVARGGGNSDGCCRLFVRGWGDLYLCW